MKKGSNSIKDQIFSGYKKMLLIIALLVVASLINFVIIYGQIERLSSSSEYQKQTTAAVASHTKWLNDLQFSMQTGKEFAGSLDGTKCVFGKWFLEISSLDLDNKTIINELNLIRPLHESIHASASEAIKINKTDKAAAYKVYEEQIMPNANEVITYLTEMSNKYQLLVDNASSTLISRIIQAIVTNVLFAALAIFIAIKIGNRTARKISKPITQVAEWSHQLSMGADDIALELEDSNIHGEDEVGSMMRSFQTMAKSIQENVNVVKRVAEGDMTSFVNIRSAKDSLGKNLYHMVQSNDLMFAEILKIADKLAIEAGEIAISSQTLAESSSDQAQSIQEFSEKIDETSEVITKTLDKTEDAMNTSDIIKSELTINNKKMDELVQAMTEIGESSEKVASVIRTIDSIAVQTNLLALNAAIEAARAGEAGKGFAVVAGEVRELAAESAKAAKESRELIQDTIKKASFGNDISVDTYDSFSKINESVNKILILIKEITDNSRMEKENIELVRKNIIKISNGVSTNAATSEEAAAASQEMNSSADILKDAMRKFNLRKREMGQAYIPPEKKDDIEFVKMATENYKKAVENGKAAI